MDFALVCCSRVFPCSWCFGTKLLTTAIPLPHACVKGGHRLFPASVGAVIFMPLFLRELGLHVSHVVVVFFFLRLLFFVPLIGCCSSRLRVAGKPSPLFYAYAFVPHLHAKQLEQALESRGSARGLVSLTCERLQTRTLTSRCSH